MLLDTDTRNRLFDLDADATPHPHQHLKVLAIVRAMAFELLSAISEARELPEGPVPTLRTCGGWVQAMADMNMLGKASLRFLIKLDLRLGDRRVDRLDRMVADLAHLLPEPAAAGERRW